MPNFCNNISYYVDSKYSLGSNDGSFLRPFTTITQALNAIGTDTGATRGTYGEPTTNSDPHLHDQFSIYVQHGIYDDINIKMVYCIYTDHINFFMYWRLETRIQNGDILIYNSSLGNFKNPNT